MTMTEEQKEAVQLLQGSLGWKVMEYMLKEKLTELNSVENLDARSVDKAGIEALAKAKAVKLLKEFLSDLTFTFGSNKSTNTYE
jgi:hypothetical protein